MIRKLFLCLAAAAVCLACTVDSESGSRCLRQNLQGGGGSTGKLRHVVLLKFKDTTSPEQVEALENAFRALPSAIDEVFNLEWGRDVSVENLAQGYTHCFMLTFQNEQDRDKYISHTAHKAFVSMLQPQLDKVLVIDYLAGK